MQSYLKVPGIGLNHSKIAVFPRWSFLQDILLVSGFLTVSYFHP